MALEPSTIRPQHYDKTLAEIFVKVLDWLDAANAHPVLPAISAIEKIAKIHLLDGLILVTSWGECAASRPHDQLVAFPDELLALGLSFATVLDESKFSEIDNDIGLAIYGERTSIFANPYNNNIYIAIAIKIDSSYLIALKAGGSKDDISRVSAIAPSILATYRSYVATVESFAGKVTDLLKAASVPALEERLTRVLGTNALSIGEVNDPSQIELTMIICYYHFFTNYICAPRGKLNKLNADDIAKVSSLFKFLSREDHLQPKPMLDILTLFTITQQPKGLTRSDISLQAVTIMVDLSSVVDSIVSRTPNEPAQRIGDFEMRVTLLRASWKLLLNSLQPIDGGASYEKEIDIFGALDKLARQTRAVFASTMCSNEYRIVQGDAEATPAEFDYLRIDNGFLLVYFLGQLLAGNFVAQALGRADVKTATGPVRPHVSVGDAREFLTHLATLALYGFYVVDRRFRQGFKQDFVDADASELGEAILYLIDRYAVLRYDLDPRINIYRNLRDVFRQDMVHQFSKDKYRNHTFHVIDVCLLGLLLLDTKVKEGDGGLVPSLTDASGVADDVFRREWILASLFHDIGYCLEIPKSTLHLMEVLQAEPNTEYAARLKDAARESESRYRRHVAEWVDTYREGHWPLAVHGPNDNPIARFTPPEHIDHGSVSFLHLLQILRTMDEQDRLLAGAKGPRHVPAHSSALFAIHAHSDSRASVSFKNDPLAALLVLCDELQEWGRRRIEASSYAMGLGASWKFGAPRPVPFESPIRFLLANLRAEPMMDDPGSVGFRARSEDLQFHLLYGTEDQTDGDPVLGFLSKARNLQRLLDLGPAAPKIAVTCCCERPEADRGADAYEAYRSFKRKTAALPLLEEGSAFAQQMLRPASSPTLPALAYCRRSLVLQQDKRLNYGPSRTWQSRSSDPGTRDCEVFGLEVKALAEAAANGHPRVPVDPHDIAKAYLEEREKVRLRVYEKNKVLQ